MPNPEPQPFSTVWFEVFGLAGIATVLLLMGQAALARTIGCIAFGMFIGGEQTARVVPPGQAGTMTGYDYWKIGNRWLRALIGVWLSALLYFTVARWLGGLFMLWLPFHLSGITKPKPWFIDRLITWVGHRVGLNIRTW